MQPPRARKCDRGRKKAPRRPKNKKKYVKKCRRRGRESAIGVAKNSAEAENEAQDGVQKIQKLAVLAGPGLRRRSRRRVFATPVTLSRPRRPHLFFQVFLKNDASERHKDAMPQQSKCDRGRKKAARRSKNTKTYTQEWSRGGRESAIGVAKNREESARCSLRGPESAIGVAKSSIMMNSHTFRLDENERTEKTSAAPRRERRNQTTGSGTTRAPQATGPQMIKNQRLAEV